MIDRATTYTFTCDWPNQPCSNTYVVRGRFKLKDAIADARRNRWSFPGRGARMVRCPVHAWVPVRPPGAPGHRQ